jgi:hypothetical protein
MLSGGIGRSCAGEGFAEATTRVSVRTHAPPSGERTVLAPMQAATDARLRHLRMTQFNLLNIYCAERKLAASAMFVKLFLTTAPFE